MAEHIPVSETPKGEEQPPYFTFGSFVQQKCQQDNVSVQDLMNASDDAFGEKYGFSKSEFHTLCVSAYKSQYPSDYDMHVSLFEKKQQAVIAAQKKQLDDFKQNSIDIVLRQTDYDRETAIEKLEAANYVAMNVIKEYLTGGVEVVGSNKPTENLSTNQQIYKQIREFMDIPRN